MPNQKRYEIQKIDEKNYKIDVSGLTCPYPQLLTMRALNSLSDDEVLEVIIDNPPSVKDIPPILEKKGFKVNTSRLDSSKWKIIVQR